MNEPVRLFVFGLGYSAGAFARALAGEAAWIGGTIRTADNVAALATAGIDAMVWDGEGAEPSRGGSRRPGDPPAGLHRPRRG